MSEDQLSPHFPNCFYRVSVKGLCVRAGKVLLCRDERWGSPGSSGVWDLPGGGLDFGEALREALVREVTEEMGVSVSRIGEKPLYLWTVRAERVRGLPWNYILILAYPFEVDNLKITPSEECREIRFFSLEELKKERNLNSQIRPLEKFFDPADFR